MAVLVTGIALMLGTTGHDGYATARLTLVEATLLRRPRCDKETRLPRWNRDPDR